MENTLITGTSGFIGWHLFHELEKRQFIPVGTYCNHDGDHRFHKLDLTKLDSINALLDSLAPNAIIHLAAASKPAFCETNKEIAYKINVKGSEALATWANAHQIPFVFASTDQIYDGENAPYGEHSVVLPINEYGRQKFEAETVIKTVCPSATLLRFALIYGKSTPYAESFLQWLERDLISNKTLQLFSDEYRTPLDVETLCNAIIESLNYPAETFQLAGNDKLSRSEIGFLVAGALGILNPNIEVIKQSEVPLQSPRPKDLAMCNEKAKRYRLMQPLSFSEMIEKILLD